MFKQLFDIESSTYTYLLADEHSHEAVIIDPVASQLDAYIILIKQHKLQLIYALETHVHADHITASGLLRAQLNAATGVGKMCGASTADLQLNDGDVIQFGQQTLNVLATPVHTIGSVSYLWLDQRQARVFTGDALLINGCGRTDFQGGDAGVLFDSITQKIFSLDDDVLVYPGHDYQGRRVSSVAQEKAINARLAGKTRDEFIEIMQNLNLPKPKLIDVAVPANRRCGVPEPIQG